MKVDIERLRRFALTSKADHGAMMAASQDVQEARAAYREAKAELDRWVEWNGGVIPDEPSEEDLKATVGKASIHISRPKSVRSDRFSSDPPGYYMPESNGPEVTPTNGVHKDPAARRRVAGRYGQLKEDFEATKARFEAAQAEHERLRQIWQLSSSLAQRGRAFAQKHIEIPAEIEGLFP